MNWSDLLERLTERRRKDASPQPNAQPKSTELAPENKELRAQRDRLLEKFTVMQADLGGAFYEMAIRDHVRLDALTRRAAELQQVDAELLAAERQLEIERTDAAGHCPACNSPFGSADRFCPQCGSSLVATEVAA